MRAGHGAASTWPAADAREAVLAASAVRLVAHRAAADAGGSRRRRRPRLRSRTNWPGRRNEQHLVASPRRRDGGVDVAIAARSLFAPLRERIRARRGRTGRRADAAADAWRWYSSGARRRVRAQPDGSAFAVSAPRRADTLPPELALALTQAHAHARRAPRIEVAFAVDDAQLSAWSEQCATPFRAARRGAGTRTAPRSPPRPICCKASSRASCGAARKAAARSSGGRWASPPPRSRCTSAPRSRNGRGCAIDAWRTSRAIVAAARNAGAGEHRDAETAAAALARRFTRCAPSRRVGRARRRAAAAGTRGAGARRAAGGRAQDRHLRAGTWTFDLAKLDHALAELDRHLATAGLATLQRPPRRRAPARHARRMDA